MVVVVNNPPGCLPVNTSGFKLARALYKAAVHPAQPEPMMTTFSIEPRKLVFRMRVGKWRFDRKEWLEARKGISSCWLPGLTRTYQRLPGPTGGLPGVSSSFIELMAFRQLSTTDFTDEATIHLWNFRVSRAIARA